MYTVANVMWWKTPVLLHEFCTTSMNADTSEESLLLLVACLVVSNSACHIEYLCSWDVWYLYGHKSSIWTFFNTGNEGHAGWTSLAPRLLHSHMWPKSWERARQQGKDWQPELFTCMYPSWGICHIYKFTVPVACVSLALAHSVNSPMLGVRNQYGSRVSIILALADKVLWRLRETADGWPYFLDNYLCHAQLSWGTV